LLYDVLARLEISMAELEEMLGQDAMMLVEGVSRPDAGQPPDSPVC
jgi:hypothetical protein